MKSFCYRTLPLLFIFLLNGNLLAEGSFRCDANTTINERRVVASNSSFVVSLKIAVPENLNVLSSTRWNSFYSQNLEGATTDTGEELSEIYDPCLNEQTRKKNEIREHFLQAIVKKPSPNLKNKPLFFANHYFPLPKKSKTIIELKGHISFFDFDRDPNSFVMIPNILEYVGKDFSTPELRSKNLRVAVTESRCDGGQKKLLPCIVLHFKKPKALHGVGVRGATIRQCESFTKSLAPIGEKEKMQFFIPREEKEVTATFYFQTKKAEIQIPYKACNIKIPHIDAEKGSKGTKAQN